MDGCTLSLNTFVFLQCGRSEREKYAKHRHKSETQPAKYLSLIIDGMDQDKTDIPHIISNPKALAGAYTLETHVTGIRAHGRCTMMVIDCGQFPHDTNLTIEVIVRLLFHFKVNVILTHVNIITVAVHYYIYFSTFHSINNRRACHLPFMFRWTTRAETIKTNTHSPLLPF